jgi:DNA polymerase-1
MYRAITDTNEVRKYISEKTILAFDFETAPDEKYHNEKYAALDEHKSHIVGVSFSAAKGEAVYVPLTHKNGTNANPAEIRKILLSFAINPTIIKVAHNLEFEDRFLKAQHIKMCRPYCCTFLTAQNTLKNDMKCGLKNLAQNVLGIQLPTFADITQGKNFDELNPQDTATINYACADADYALQLYHIFKRY